MNVDVEKCCFTWQPPLQSLDVLVVWEAVSPDLPLPCRESTCWHTGANVGEEEISFQCDGKGIFKRLAAKEVATNG